MWWLKKIPKVLHTYFGGQKISYLRYLTLQSFRNLNPDWTIKFYYPTIPQKNISWVSFEQKYEFNGDDYFDEIKNLNINMVPFDCTTIGIDPNISEVYKSDFLRWYLLGTEGGLWSDLDIIYFKGMEAAYFNNLAFANTDTGICICSYGHSVGFMFGSERNSYYKILWNNSKKAWNNHNYQCIGSILANTYFPTTNRIRINLKNLHVLNLDMALVYAYNANDIDKIYTSSNMGKFTDKSIGLHWYAGHTKAGEYLNKTNGGKENLPDNVLSRTIRVMSTSIPQYINSLINSDTTILDLGCGVREINKVLIGKTTTLDVWSKFNPDIIWNLENTPLPFIDNSYNFTLLIDVIEHLPKDKGFKLLEDIKRITKNRIILLTPLWWTENKQHLKDINSPYYKNKFEIHKSLWTKEDFVGWKEINEVSFIGNYLFMEWIKNNSI